jgi:hypothetical protein
MKEAHRDMALMAKCSRRQDIGLCASARGLLFGPRRLRRHGQIPLALALLVSSLSASAAQKEAAQGGDSRPDPDLLKLVMPDLHEKPESPDILVGRKLAEVREIKGFEFGSFEYDPESNYDIEISDVNPFWIRSEGRRLVVIVFGIDATGGGIAQVAALIDETPEPKLLDLVNITADQHTSVEDRLIDISSSSQAFEIDNWHDNSSESYDIISYFAAVGGKLKVVLDGPAYVGTTDYNSRTDRVCKTAYEHRMHLLPTSHSGYHDIALDVTELKVCHGGQEDWSWDTGIVRRKRTREIWRWNPRHAAYETAHGRTGRANGSHHRPA